MEKSGESRAKHNERKNSRLSKYSAKGRHVVESPAKIGAFNVRRFGKAKMHNAEVVQILKFIVLHFDILLVQEIVDSSGDAVLELLDAVNDGKDIYSLEVSLRLGRNKAKGHLTVKD